MPSKYLLKHLGSPFSNFHINRNHLGILILLKYILIQWGWGGAWDPAFSRGSQLPGDAASPQTTLWVQRSRSFSKSSARKHPVPCRVDAEVENSQKKITMSYFGGKRITDPQDRHSLRGWWSESIKGHFLKSHWYSEFSQFPGKVQGTFQY